MLIIVYAQGEKEQCRETGMISRRILDPLETGESCQSQVQLGNSETEI